mmetsp:Transcript_136166/g.379578  ORF Transcript_136166/g.379578 Transcript_136166/m.379578 type:complete len:539 (-) Transcript_136166:48-1664(-)
MVAASEDADDEKCSEELEQSTEGQLEACEEAEEEAEATEQVPDGAGEVKENKDPKSTEKERIAEDAEDSEPEVVEELKDAIEGSLRLKRILRLNQDVDMPSRKKRRVEVEKRSVAENAKVSLLLNKWGLAADPLTRHVLENLSSAELSHLISSNYVPDVTNMWKCPAELLQTHTNLVRESKGPGGGPLDRVSCFRHQWKLDLADERLLRELNHKDLRYVMKRYDGTAPLHEVAAAAARSRPEEEGVALGAVPDAPGVTAMGRYSRLELIDPVAHSAVFGDANLTFSLNLARQRKALGHVGRVVATTFEPLETLQERYKEIDETIQKLEEHFAEVYHSVDCTRIAIDSRFNGMVGALGAVYYNFPHAGAVGGFFDGHPVVNWRHENLMRLFFRALRSYVTPGGIVKVASNSGAVGVRFSYIIGSATENEFVHVETMPFLQWQLHRYGRSYGDRRDIYKRPGEGEQYNSQRADSDMVYCFVYTPSGRTLPRQQIRLPPTHKTMLGVSDGPLGERHGEAKKQFAKELWKRFMMECSGMHVG